jgi:hypothetical protein
VNAFVGDAPIRDRCSVDPTRSSCWTKGVRVAARTVLELPGRLG